MESNKKERKPLYHWINPRNIAAADPDFLFADRDFLLLWFSQVTSQIAAGVFGIVIALVTQIEGLGGNYENSAFGVALVILFTNAPALFFSIFAGVLADWFDRKKIMFLANVSRFVLAMFFVVVSGWSIPVIAYTIILLKSGITQIFMPAEASIIPDVVKPKNIILANTIFNLTTYITYILGIVGAGQFIKLFGERDTFFVLGVLFIAGAAVIPFIRSPKRESKVDKTKLFRLMAEFVVSLKDGVKYVFKGKIQRFSLLHNFITTSILLVLSTIIFKMGSFLLRIDPKDIGIAAILPIGIGLMISLIYINTGGKSRKRIALSHDGVIVAMIGFTLISIASLLRINIISLELSTIDSIVLLISTLASFLIGFSFPLLVIPPQTLLQEDTQEEFRGRVYGVWYAVNQTFATIPALIVGLIADSSLGIPAAMLLITVTIILYFIYLIPLREEA